MFLQKIDLAPISQPPINLTIPPVGVRGWLLRFTHELIPSVPFRAEAAVWQTIVPTILPSKPALTLLL